MWVECGTIELGGSRLTDWCDVVRVWVCRVSVGMQSECGYAE